MKTLILTEKRRKGTWFQFQDLVSEPYFGMSLWHTVEVTQKDLEMPLKPSGRVIFSA